ncbi:MAG: RNA polymerase sigma factor (sigma-70 family) [Bacteroidia bacterium]|jgi:RNA polymerase sigma factor (sigma-70 family)
MMAQTATANLVFTQLNDVEQELLNGCLDKNRAAQKKLYLRYSTAMYTLAYRITNDQDAAHDVLQDAFIEVFRDLHTFKAKSTLGAWIKTIVARKAGKQVKFEQRYEALEIDLHDTAVPYEDIASILLEKIIAMLPIGCRTVFTLFEIEGYKHKEIANMLNIAESTSRTQLLHAKKLLREQLKGEMS